jgi:hypothetical protein
LFKAPFSSFSKPCNSAVDNATISVFFMFLNPSYD